jgi:hypothetical protein
MLSQLGMVRLLKVIHQGRQAVGTGSGIYGNIPFKQIGDQSKSVSRVVPTTCVKLIVCQVVVKSSRVYVSEARKKRTKVSAPGNVCIY